MHVVSPQMTQRNSFDPLRTLSTPKLDRLWLLDRLAFYKTHLADFMHNNMCAKLNSGIPPSGQEAIPSIAVAAWRDELVAFEAGRVPWVPLSAREVHQRFVEEAAGGTSDSSTYIQLTPRGGRLWESEFEVRWDEYVDVAWDAEGTTTIIASTREHVQKTIDSLPALGRWSIVWKVVEPWRPTDWKILPRGFQATVKGEEQLALQDINPLRNAHESAWRAEEYKGLDPYGWVDLAKLPGWTAETSIPTMSMHDATVHDAFAYFDHEQSILQLRLELSNGTRGILEIGQLRWKRVWPWISAFQNGDRGTLRAIDVDEGETRMELATSKRGVEPPRATLRTHTGRWWRYDAPTRRDDDE